jgi:transcription initiation factor TFIID TATA-box-binding protein
LEAVRRTVKLQYTIKSVLASARISESLPIEELRAHGIFPEHDEMESLHRMSFRVGPRRRFVTLFGNGTATIRGCRSIPEAQALLEDVRRAVRQFAKVSEGGLRIVVQNIVALADLGTRVDLAKLSEGLAAWNVSYEPEQFPGLVLRLGDGKPTVLVFSSGKLVIVGTRSEDQLDSTLREARGLLP